MQLRHTRWIGILQPSCRWISRVLVLSCQLLIWVAAEADRGGVISEGFSIDDGVLWVEPGSTVHLKCLSQASALLQWYHDGQLLGPTSSHVTITTSLDIGSGRQTSLLSRNGVGSHETGSYECWDIRASRSEGSVTVQLSTTINDEKVRVQIVEPSSESVSIVVDSTFDLRCTGSLNARLVWFHNDDLSPLLSQDELTIHAPPLDHRRPGTTTSLLRLTRVTARHAGTYSCRNQRDPSDRDDISISIENGRSGAYDYHGDNGVVIMDANVVTLRMSSELTLDCSFEAAEGAAVSVGQQWSKDGQQLTSNDNSPTSKYLISRNSTTLSSSLRIRNTDRSDAGLYRCIFRRTDFSGQAIATVQFNVTTLSCPPIVSPVNGRLDICPQPSVFGDTCTFSCRHGYRLTDPRPVRCERRPDGQTYWTRKTPTCRATTIQLADLTGSSSLGGIFVADLPSTVSHVLLRVGESLVLECSGRTTWSRRGVVLENSLKYAVDNRSLTIRNTDRGDVGIYDCTVVKETVAGNFRFNVTTLPCPPFPAFYGTVDWCPVESSVYGDTCLFRCPSGSRLIGSRLRSCELHGSNNMPYWTGQPAFCTVSAESLIASSKSASDIPLHSPTASAILLCVLKAAAASAFTHQ